MKQQSRNLPIDFVKFCLAIIVALGHYGISGKIDGGFAVTVFFLISGYYFMKGMQRKNESSISFIMRKIKKLYTPYITVFSVLLFYNVANKVFTEKTGYREIIKYLFNSLQEVFLLQGLGFCKDPVNPTMWFFSVLIISVFIIHKIVSLNEKVAIKYIFPIIIISTMPVFLGNFDPWGKVFGFMYIPLIKGFATLLIGIYTYYIEKWYNKKFSKGIRYVLSILSFAGCLCIGSSSYIYIVLTIFILLPLYNLKLNIVDDELKNKLGNVFGLSDYIYFSHFMVITGLHVFSTVLNLSKINMYIYIVVVLFAAVILDKWCKLVKKK